MNIYMLKASTQWFVLTRANHEHSGSYTILPASGKHLFEASRTCMQSAERFRERSWILRGPTSCAPRPAKPDTSVQSRASRLQLVHTVKDALTSVCHASSKRGCKFSISTLIHFSPIMAHLSMSQELWFCNFPTIIQYPIPSYPSAKHVSFFSLFSVSLPLSTSTSSSPTSYSGHQRLETPQPPQHA